MIPLPEFLSSRIVWSIGEAERLKGGPVNPVEVTVVFQMTYTRWIYRGYLGLFVLNLYRKDLFYTDREFTLYSLTGPDGTEAKAHFELFSEKFRRLYPGYELEPWGHIRAMPSTPVINLKQLMALFKSKNAILWERNKWIFENNCGGAVFLDG